MASWYRDSTAGTIDAALALESAGALGKAFGHLAKIPLDIDDRRLKQAEVDNQAASVKATNNNANSRLQGEKIKANAKIGDAQLDLEGKKVAAAGTVQAAQLGLQGRETAANARREDTAAKERNNKRTTGAMKDGYEYGVIRETIKGANAKDVQKLKNKQKAPTQTEEYDEAGTLIKKTVRRGYVPDEDFDVEKMKKIEAETKSKKKP
jgi:hypothetical protein